MAAQGKIRIGISGWRYRPWRGVFYPPKLAQKRELEFAAQAFSTIEINGTFYSLQRPESFAQWHDETPEDFVFAVKGSRYITHMLKLKEPEHALANFFASGLLQLRKKFGPILWQFPPNFHFNAERMAAFYALLPRDTEDALKLARKHDKRLEGRAWLKVKEHTRLRHAVEIRHDSFRAPDFIAQLRKHKIGLVVADTVDWPLLMDVTADFVYVRLHGSEQLYASGYGPEAIAVWAKRVAAWATGGEPEDAIRASGKPAPRRKTRDVYVYFDNDIKVRAPFDAQALRAETEWLLAGAKPGR
jgi:uncharacterized protein YecE (DUF72 family)